MFAYFKFGFKIGLKVVVIAGLAFVQIAVFGCAASPKKVAVKATPAQRKKAALSTFYTPMLPSEGSLWTDHGELLFTDKRARKVGDTVVVDIVENSTSKLDANTTSERTSTLKAGATNFLGYSSRLAARPSSRKSSGSSYMDPTSILDLNYGSKTEGKGSIDRSGQVTASIGASVTEVLPNSNLVVYGRREMKVNDETQYITVSGIVRPEDVGPDNRVKSTYLADAKIVYSGRGVLADKQKSGWMARLLDTVWPF